MDDTTRGPEHISAERLLELGDLPIHDDDALLERARTLIQHGVVRRMWLLMLDDDGMQLPLLPQIDGIPVSPDAETTMTLRVMLGQLAEYCAQVAFVLERPGRAEPSPDDLAWADAIGRAARGADVRVRGVLLAHGEGLDRLHPWSTEPGPPRIVAA